MSQSSSVSISTLLKSYLAELYPTHLGDLYDQIRERVGTPSDQPRRVQSENDALLIVYGDQLRSASESKQKPLATLANFYNQHLKNSFSGVHLLPFYPSTSDGGFAVRSYLEVDEAIGTWSDLAAFEGDLMFDGVFNHTSSQHEWFQKWLAGDDFFEEYYHHFNSLPTPGSPAAQDLEKVIRPRSTDLLAEFQRGKKSVYVWATFGPDQLDVNFSSPKVFMEFVKILLFYVDKGAKYIRVDAVPFMWKELGTDCMHHPKTHCLVKALRAVLDLYAPQVQLITESNVPHEENISYLDNGHDEAQLVYNFSLAPLILYSLENQNCEALKTWVANLKPLPGEGLFFNFTATHDGIGVRPLEGILPDDEVLTFAERMKEKGGLVNFRRLGGENRPYELNITWTSALYDEDPKIHVQKVLTSYAMALVFPGVPGVYFHNLVGSINWHDGVKATKHNRDINRRKFDLNELEHMLQLPFHREIFEKSLQQLQERRQHKVFHPRADFVQRDTQSGVWHVERHYQGQRGSFYFNLTDEIQKVDGLTLAPYAYQWRYN